MAIDVFNKITYLQRLDNFQNTNSFLFGLNSKKYAVVFKDNKYNILEDHIDLRAAVEEAMHLKIWQTPLDDIKQLPTQSQFVIAKIILSKTVKIDSVKKPIITKTQTAFFTALFVLATSLFIQFYLNRPSENNQIQDQLPLDQNTSLIKPIDPCEQLLNASSFCPPCICPKIECPSTYKWLKEFFMYGLTKILRKN
jgi:hypothetical protein